MPFHTISHTHTHEPGYQSPHKSQCCNRHDVRRPKNGIPEPQKRRKTNAKLYGGMVATHPAISSSQGKPSQEGDAEVMNLERIPPHMQWIRSSSTLRLRQSREAIQSLEIECVAFHNAIEHSAVTQHALPPRAIGLQHSTMHHTAQAANTSRGILDIRQLQ